MGTVIGPLFVRRSVLINATQERVWQEFRSLDRLQAWLGLGHQLHKFELEMGGAVKLSVEIDGETRFFGGKITWLEHEHEVTFENQWQSPSDWAVPTFLTYKLTPLYGSTLVEFFHHGFERLGNDAADNLQGYEEGWALRHLAALRQIVESGAGAS